VDALREDAALRRLKKNLSILPGLALVVAIALAARWTHARVPSHIGKLVGEVIFAVGYGLLIGNVFRIPDAAKPGIKFAYQTLLRTAIVILGATFSFGAALSIGGRAILMVVGFGAVDTIFLASNSLKIFEGGWFPISVGGAMVALMLCWRLGSSLVRQRLQEMSMPLKQFIDNIDTMVVARPPGMGVWLTKVAHGASPVLLHHIKHNSVMHKTLVLMTFISDRRPRVPFGERHVIERLGHGIYHIHVRLGFMQTPDIPLSLKNCQILGFTVDLEHVHYYIAHEIVARRAKHSAMAAVPFAVFAFLTRIASRAPDFFKIPAEGLSEVGFRIEI